MLNTRRVLQSCRPLLSSSTSSLSLSSSSSYKIQPRHFSSDPMPSSSSSSSSSSSYPFPLKIVSPPTIPPSRLADLLAENATPPTSPYPRIIPVDASWFMPNDPQKRTVLSSFLSKRIPPDARFFDLDYICLQDSPYPHMLPTPTQFRDGMRTLQLRREDGVVLYDSPDQGIFASPRVAWTFQVFGHKAVTVLDNFTKYVAEGRPIEEGPTRFLKRGLGEKEQGEGLYPDVEADMGMVADFDEVYLIAWRNLYPEKAKKDAPRVQILDARAKGRFMGENPEPRKGIESGHVPGALSVPFGTLLDPDMKCFLPKEKLREVLEKAGVDPDPKIQKISMCGTGVTAVIIDLAMKIAGFEETPESRMKVYDGSWTEWAQRVPEGEGMIEKGEPKIG